MFDAPMPLRHSATPQPDDTALAQASRSHVAGNRALQLIAELIAKLRGSQLPWWTPEVLRGAWDATGRMEWFEQRPDIRQRITCALTGLKPNAARNSQPEFQAALIDSVIDEGDVTVAEFENAFDAIELAAYAPAATIWQRFREQMPWDEDVPENQALVAWLIERLLGAGAIEGMTREPILTPNAVRTAIPGKLWHSKIPLDIRVAIDESRFEAERENPGEPFHAAHDLAIATPAIIAANIPLRELLCVLDVAERAMGLPPARDLPAAAARMAAPAKAEPPKAEVKAPPAMPAPEPQKVTEVAKAEPAKADVKAQPAPAGKAPEKPAEKPSDRAMDRWERMATKVLEKVGKESTDEPWDAKR